MKSFTHEPRAMEVEGAELQLSGSFPPGAFAHLQAMLASMYAEAAKTPKVKERQRLERIPDVVTQSALEMCDQDMAEAEEQFQREESAIEAADGVIAEHERKIADALETLREAIENAEAAGIRFMLDKAD